jgi:hypothetical protein
MTYCETVGILQQIWRQQYIKADFKAEQDRILAAIMRQSQETTVVERPEFSEAGTTPVGGDAIDADVSDLGRLGNTNQVPRASSVPTTTPPNEGQPE